MNLDTLLAILQQSEYHLNEFRTWYQMHQHEARSIKPQTWSVKLKLIRVIAQILFFLPVLWRIQLAVVLLWPFEWLIRIGLFSGAFVKLRFFQLRGLKIVAIAGSYGKTSTKQILQHVLSSQTSVLMTPDSYNTAIGISLITLKKLQPHHKVFVVELGEFYPNHVAHLAAFVRPNFGILTKVGRQHLERLGSLDQIAQTLLGLAHHLRFDSQKLLLSEDYRPYLSVSEKTALTFYGSSVDAQLRVVDAHLSRAGTEFAVQLPPVTKADAATQNLKAFSPLFGEHQAVNTLPAIWLAQKLDLNMPKTIAAIATLPYISRRHEPTFAQQNVLILDNSYNTNPESAQESLRLLNQLQPSRRFFITLGFVELGSESQKIHREYGQQLAKQADWIGLIEAPWTAAIQEGFLAAGGLAERVVVGKTQEEAFAKLQPQVIPNSVIIFEGGFQEIFV